MPDNMVPTDSMIRYVVMNHDMSLIRKISGPYDFSILKELELYNQREIGQTDKKKIWDTDHFFYKLIPIATVKGWNLTLTYVLNRFSINVNHHTFKRPVHDHVLRGYAEFWFMISVILNRQFDKDQGWEHYFRGSINDANIEHNLNDVETELHSDVTEIIDCTSLLEFCLSNAFINSAAILIDLGVKLDHETACKLYLERNNNNYRGIELESNNVSMRNAILGVFRSSNKLDTAMKLIERYIESGYFAPDWCEIAVYFDAWKCEGSLLTNIDNYLDGVTSDMPNIDVATRISFENRRNDLKYIKNAAENQEDVLLDKLVQRNYRVNDNNKYEESVLHTILRRYPYTDDTLIMCGHLVENHANVFKQNHSNKTPWHIIAESCDIRMLWQAMRCMLWGRYNNLYEIWRDEKGRIPLFHATRQVYTPLVDDVFLCMLREFEFDLLSQDDDLFTPLHQLASIGDFDRTQMALEHQRRIQKPINTIPGSDLIPGRFEFADISLMEAAAENCRKYYSMSSIALWFPIDIDDSEEQKNLCRNQRSEYLNRKNNQGQTVLFVACKYGHIARIKNYMKLMIWMGAWVNILSNGSDTLMHAIASPKVPNRLYSDRSRPTPPGHIFDLLYYIDSLNNEMIFTKNAKGQYPLHLAVKHGMYVVMTALIQVANRSFQRVHTPEEVHKKMSNYLNTATQKPTIYEGWTPLHKTLKYCRRCIQNMADSDYDHLVLGEKLENYVKMAQTLIASGAKVDNWSRSIGAVIASKYPLIERVRDLTFLLELSTKEPSKHIFGRFTGLPHDVFNNICQESRKPSIGKLLRDIELDFKPTATTQDEFDDKDDLDWMKAEIIV